MSTPANWGETAAGMLAGGSQVEGPWERRAREFASPEHQRAVAEFAAAVDADPAWKFARELQRQQAARGLGPSAWIQIGDTRPPELRALWNAEHAAEARTGTWGPSGPTNDIAREMDQHARDRLLAAQLRQQAMNLPRGLEGL